MKNIFSVIARFVLAVILAVAFAQMFWFCSPEREPEPPKIEGVYFKASTPDSLFIFDPGSRIHCRGEKDKLAYYCKFNFEQCRDTVFICPNDSDLDEIWLVEDAGPGFIEVRILDCRLRPGKPFILEKEKF